jgi:hypothetical protein
MMRRWHDFAVNLGLVFASILLFLGFCELVVFRLVWLASDAPVNAFVDGVVRYMPNQHGIWRVRDRRLCRGAPAGGRAHRDRRRQLCRGVAGAA